MIETPQTTDNPATTPVDAATEPRKTHLITRETAKANQAKAVAARKANALAAKQLAASYQPIPHPVNQPTPQTETPKRDTRPFAGEALSRVRKQLRLLWVRMDDAAAADPPDAQRIDRLASAISRLSELERQLADRPLPGSKRPAAAKGQTSGMMD